MSPRDMTMHGALTSLSSHGGKPVKFGSVRFAGSKRKPSKWAAVDASSSIHNVVSLMCDTWGLTPPPVLISVTGAASGNLMKPKEQAIFRRGLREAAHQTHAWIVTGGTHAGVMKLVGTMLQEDESDKGKTVCLGIATWGSVYS